MSNRKVLTNTKYAPYIIKFLQQVHRSNYTFKEVLIPFPDDKTAYRALMGLNAARRHLITLEQGNETTEGKNGKAPAYHDGFIFSDTSKIWIKKEGPNIRMRWDDPADEFPMFAVGPDGTVSDTPIDASDITYGSVRKSQYQRMINPEYIDPPSIHELPNEEDPVNPEAFAAGLFSSEEDDHKP
jgi:hypothetical protein